MIDIIDDVEIEPEEESFFVALERADTVPDGIQLLERTAEVSIYDNDRKSIPRMQQNNQVYHIIVSEATLGFRELIVSVREELERVEVCLEVTSPSDTNCPVYYPIKFVVSTFDRSAGNSVTTSYIYIIVTSWYSGSGVDYIQPNSSFSYSSCSKRDCFNIAILDDMELEAVESFIVSLTPDAGIRNAIVLNQDTIQINIIDNDGELTDRHCNITALHTRLMYLRLVPSVPGSF